MAVPKRRKSRSRHRRAQWKAAPPDLVPVTTRDDRRLLIPPRLVNAYRRGLL
jgi:large subunit ribosomal protein L32